MYEIIKQTKRVTSSTDTIETNCASLSIQNDGVVAFTINDSRSITGGKGIVWPVVHPEAIYTQPLKIQFATGAGDKLCVIEMIFCKPIKP